MYMHWLCLVSQCIVISLLVAIQNYAIKLTVDPLSVSGNYFNVL